LPWNLALTIARPPGAQRTSSIIPAAARPRGGGSTPDRTGRGLALVFLLAALAALPWTAGTYALSLGALLLIYMTLAVSYDILGGYAGLMNLGHSAFFGLGAYAFGIALTRGWPPPAAVVASVAVPLAFAALISYPIFRLRGACFALATFGLIPLLELLALNLGGLTGGSQGFTIPLANRIEVVYYAALVLAAWTVWVSYRIAHSPLGLALMTIREDEDVARSFGVAPYRHKLRALLIGAAPAGLVGAVYAMNLTYLTAEVVLGTEIALVPVTMAVLGGSGTVAGPIVGAVIVTAVQELLWTRTWYLRLVVYGLLLVLGRLFVPGGLVRLPALRRLVARLGLGERIYAR